MMLARQAGLASALLAAALLLAACSGGDSDDPTATPSAATVTPNEALSITAADGRAVLTVPEGALPPGVDASDIQIVPIPLDDFETSENTVVLAAYELTPDGLQLARPAVLRLSLGDGAEGGLIFILHLSEDSVEFLQIRLPADGTALLNEVEVEVSHFSDIVGARIREDLKKETAKAFPGTIAVEGGSTHVVGMPFDVTGAVATKPVDVTVELGGSGTPTLRITFRGEFEPKELSFRTDPEEKVQPISGPPLRGDAVSRGRFETKVDGGPTNPFVWPFVCEEVSEFNRIDFDAVGTVKVDWERYGPEGTLFRSNTDEIEVFVKKNSHVNCVASATASPTETTTEPADGEAVAVGEGSGEEVPEEPTGQVRTPVLILGGERYPFEQFRVAEHAEGCKDGQHYHADAEVLSLEGGSMSDPGGCGFGLVGAVEKKTVDVDEDIWAEYRNRVAGN